MGKKQKSENLGYWSGKLGKKQNLKTLNVISVLANYPEILA